VNLLQTNGYFDHSKAITNDQYIHNAASKVSELAISVVSSLGNHRVNTLYLNFLKAPYLGAFKEVLYPTTVRLLFRAYPRVQAS